MEWWGWVLIAVGVVALGAIAQRLGYIDLRGDGRRGGSTAGLVGSLDEVFAPTRHEAQLERDRQTSLPAPAPIPGGGHHSVLPADGDPDAPDRFRGSIRL